MDNKTKKYTIGITVVFIIFFYLSKYYKEKKDNEIQGIWSTRENDGINFVFNFYKKDSLLIIDNQKNKKYYEVEFKRDSIFIFDNDLISFKWKIKNESDNHLILIDNESILNLYK